jgi:hypothetical protein
MVVIAARRDEGGLRTVPLNEVKAQHADVKVKRTFQVGHFEVNVADPDTGID